MDEKRPPSDNNDYQQRQKLRVFLQWVCRSLLKLLTELKVEGKENFPTHGPLLMVGNHFNFADPVAFISIAPRPVEFVGGAQFPNAPRIVRALPKLWGYLPLYRGTGATHALREAEKILKRGGLLGIFPEGGSWATVLRPARPGAAFLSTRTGVKLLPVGLDGLPNVFPSLRKFKRAKVTIRIGEPFGPFEVKGSGRKRREQINQIGDKIMQHIAPLIPPERRGFYSDDPAIREAAKGTEVYPWDHLVEGEVKGTY